MGLCWFYQGHSFKQWTRDDSKVLMKVPVLIFYIWSWYKLWYYLQVYLPALKGYIPDDMICALHAFLDFCYLAHCDVLNTQSLIAMQDTLDHFHQYWEIFLSSGVCVTISFPMLTITGQTLLFLYEPLMSQWHHYDIIPTMTSLLYHYDLIPLHSWHHPYLWLHFTPLRCHHQNTINTAWYRSLNLTCSYLVTW